MGDHGSWRARPSPIHVGRAGFQVPRAEKRNAATCSAPRQLALSAMAMSQRGDSAAPALTRWCSVAGQSSLQSLTVSSHLLI